MKTRHKFGCRLDLDGATGSYTDLTFNNNECELHMPHLTNQEMKMSQLVLANIVVPMETK